MIQFTVVFAEIIKPLNWVVFDLMYKWWTVVPRRVKLRCWKAIRML